MMKNSTILWMTQIILLLQQSIIYHMKLHHDESNISIALIYFPSMIPDIIDPYCNVEMYYLLCSIYVIIMFTFVLSYHQIHQRVSPSNLTEPVFKLALG